jgi:hypothetical protein
MLDRLRSNMSDDADVAEQRFRGGRSNRNQHDHQPDDSPHMQA